VTVRSQGDDVTVVDVTGPVDARSGNGDVTILNSTSDSIRAETLDGDLSFSGALARGGSYFFSVHDGDATFALPRDVGARVTIKTFDGEFSSDFPVTLQRYGGSSAFDFTLGDGGARLEVEVFDGEIQILERQGSGMEG
jgi:DUF4097 and DUF4098 domain-containing protein YvlB